MADGDLRREALARLARRARERSAGAIPRRAGDGRASFAQERMWFLEQLHPGATTNQLPIGLHLRGTLDVGALERALAELARRHEALRTALVLVQESKYTHALRVGREEEPGESQET